MTVHKIIQGELNYCGTCGTKFKEIEEEGVEFRYCKKCKIYFPKEAKYWMAFEGNKHTIDRKNEK